MWFRFVPTVMAALLLVVLEVWFLSCCLVVIRIVLVRCASWPRLCCLRCGFVRVILVLSFVAEAETKQMCKPLPGFVSVSGFNAGLNAALLLCSYCILS